MFTHEQEDRQTIVVRGRIDADNLPQSTRVAQAGSGRTPLEVEQFIATWQGTSGSERANKDSFIRDLCSVLGVPPPRGRTGDPEKDTYVFEADAIIQDEDGHKFGKMDLYKQGYLILEAKQGSAKGSKKKGSAVRDTPGWSIAMNDAAGQAFGYSKGVAEPPPFVIVTDIGYCFDLYACFDGSGAYRPFPNNQKNRLHLKDFAKHADTLRTIWTDPRSLDPATRSLAVTKEVAEELAKLATELERDGHSPDVVAKFLMRCVFTMFAEDIGLLREGIFTASLEKTWVPEPESFKEGVEALWDAMNAGKRFYILGKLLHFNGGLFAEPVALALNKKQLKILLSAAKREWGEVEPAIFGTLIERALNPKERHRLGAHFTPTSYVERVLRPTIEEPLRADWDAVRIQVRRLVAPDEPTSTKKLKEAQGLVREFQNKLCNTTVLDPACGSGNFLYLALNLFKRLESEVQAMLHDLGLKQLDLVEELVVTPRQFKGIEVRPGSKEIAELVLWIGYLQWHHRMYGQEKRPPEPILRDYQNIECRDALITYDRKDFARDEHGTELTRWDGVTMKQDKVTGRDVPDDTSRVQVFDYVNPRKADWPKADYIVGNPPFIGGWKIRQALGDGYVKALWSAYDSVPEKADYVMYWWDRAAEAVRSRQARRFGLITTNSIVQIFQRRVLQRHLDANEHPVRISFAIPDHPWVDTANSAAVRVAMTTGGLEDGIGQLGRTVSEDDAHVEIAYSQVSAINSELTEGAESGQAVALKANEGLCSPGVQLYGAGFIVDEEERVALSRTKEKDRAVVRPYVNGRDIMGQSRNVHVIDFFGLSEEEAMAKHPAAFQRVLDRVKPERMQNRRAPIREKWWRFGWERPVWRQASQGLKRYIATPETSKHRVFVFLSSDVLPDNMVTNFALDDAYSLGVLSSRVHVAWAMAVGGTLEDRPRYNKTVCFDPFPFPVVSESDRRAIGEIAENLDAHRKARQGEHPKLTLTAMYNVVDKLRLGASMTSAERIVHDQALCSVLMHLHDTLDQAVLRGYGWQSDLPDREIVDRLIALNSERAREEVAGTIRWLRPAFQKPKTSVEEERERQHPAATGQTRELPWWPKELPRQVALVRDFILARRDAISANDVALAHMGAKEDDIKPVLEALETLGVVASFDNGQKRWKGLAKTTGERIIGPGIARSSSRPPPPSIPVQNVG